MARPIRHFATNQVTEVLLALGAALNDGGPAVFVRASGDQLPGSPHSGAITDTTATDTITTNTATTTYSDTALVVESSGSTGTPKRFEISSSALLTAAAASHERLGGPGQWLLALPINFVAGANVLARSLLADQAPVVMAPGLPFTAIGFARSASLMRGARRYTSIVPTQLERLRAEVEAATLDSRFVLDQLLGFDAILVGGQAPSPQTVALMREWGVPLIITYGMTETCGGVVYDGQPLAGVRVELAGGQRIKVGGPTLASEFREAGEVFTNDLGEFDQSGRLRVLGRIDRVIASGGIKISLDAVEQLGATVPGVVALAAVVLTDREWGQRVGIAYQGSPEVATDIAAALAAALGPAGKPLRVIRVDRLPLLANGKTDLVSLRSLFESGPASGSASGPASGPAPSQDSA